MPNFSWGGRDLSHAHDVPMPRWRFVLAVIAWALAFGGILVWLVK